MSTKYSVVIENKIYDIAGDTEEEVITKLVENKVTDFELYEFKGRYVPKMEVRKVEEIV